MGEEGFAAEQTEILRGIWQSIKDLGQNLGGRIDQTNARLDQTNAGLDRMNARLDQMNARLDQVNTRLDRTNAQLDQTNARLDSAVDRIERLEEQGESLRAAFTQMEMRLATELVEVRGQLITLIDHLKAHQADSARLNDCEVDIRDLKRRVSSLEGPASRPTPPRA
ncbi:MAG: hypothetical protein IT186_12160, partial [Acidobacteria bacterium]|nr:hypothetical protein [Acidobacteriota bacterium]